MDSENFDTLAYVLTDDQLARLCGLLAVTGHFIKDVANTPVPREKGE